MKWIRKIGRSTYNTLRAAVKHVGIKKIGERTGLPWMFSEKTRPGDPRFDENTKGEVANRTKERKDLWEVMVGVAG